MAERDDDKAPGFEATVSPAQVVDLYGRQLGVGAQVGYWIVEEFRSMGGFASVYRVVHFHTREIAALKVLHQELTRWPTILARFDREAHTIRKLRHPNICRLVDVGQLPDNRPYYVMEWLDGNDLEQTLRDRGPMSPEEVLAIMEDVCGAIAMAHQHGIVHRDVKPANIVLVPGEPRPRAVLVDFGLAKVLEPDAAEVRLTTTGALLGTPFSMAPEQLAGGAINERTDVYGLGVTLFHLLTGTKPYRGDTIVEIEEAHMHAPPPKASELVAVSPAIDQVILRALAKNPDERFASAPELLDALRAAVTLKEPRTVSAVMRAAAVDQALGIFIEVRVDEEAGDEAFDEADDLLWSIRERLEELGMSVPLETGSTFLAVAPPVSGPPPETVRRHWLALARELVSDTATAEGVSLVVAVHCDRVVRQGDEMRDGPLLDLESWARDLPAGGVLASAATVEGLDDLETDPHGVAGDFARLRR